MEVQVLGQHGQVGEEVASGSEFFPDFLPQPAHLVADGVDGEGDEVEHQRHVGQAFLAVSEVVFEVVSVVLEFVEGFVFDFPSASCAVEQLPDVVSRDRDGGVNTKIKILSTPSKLIQASYADCCISARSSPSGSNDLACSNESV